MARLLPIVLCVLCMNRVGFNNVSLFSTKSFRNFSLLSIIPSDVAVMIAEHLGGSVENFAKMMNHKAKEIGCCKTNFVTPNGLDDDNH